MNGGLIYKAPCRWNNWCMKERKPCSVVGDIKVIIFVGTKIDGLNYYGIMDNHFINTCVSFENGMGVGAYPLLSSLTFNPLTNIWIKNIGFSQSIHVATLHPNHTLITPYKLYGKVNNTHIVVTWMQVVY